MTRTSLWPLAVVTGVTVFSLWFTAVAQAQDVACQDRNGMVAALAAKYGESLRGSFLGSPRSGFPGQVFEVWASDGGGSWTVIVTSPGGVSCVLGWGNDWQEHEPVIGTGA